MLNYEQGHVGCERLTLEWRMLQRDARVRPAFVKGSNAYKTVKKTYLSKRSELDELSQRDEQDAR